MVIQPLTTLVLKAVCGGLSSVALPGALAVGRAMGWVYGSVVRYHRSEALAALRRSFPERSEAEVRAIVKRMYANLGMNLAELCRLDKVTDEHLRDFIRWEGEEHLRGALARGKGALVLTAHVGNWDLICAASPKFGIPLTIITKDIKNKALNDFWMKIRQRFGLRFVPAHRSYRACLHALKDNGVVGFVLDQNMIRTEGVFVDFFGRPACTTPGLAYLSAQSGAPVVPGFMVREEGGRHRVTFLPPIEPPPDREPATVQRFTQQYTKIIEDKIRQHPDQWIWIHRRWRTVPLKEEP